MEFTARQIAALLDGAVEGNPETRVNSFSKIEEGRQGSLTFLSNPKYEQFIYDTEASIVLVNDDFAPSAPVRSTLIRVPNAYASIARLLEYAGRLKPAPKGIAPTAHIAPTASIGADCYVGPYACIAEGVTIGANSRIYPHCVIDEGASVGSGSILYPQVTVYAGCVIGDNCIIHAGAVIGADGFGFAPEGESYTKIPQLGNVVIEDNVEIGANAAVDRAMIGSTVIRKGVKIDNLVQIAHNVEVGCNTVMAAQTGVSGSVKIGSGCRLGGQSGLAGHIRIGDNVSIGAQAGVIGNIDEGSIVLGAPAVNARGFMRSYAIFNRLPDIYRTIGALQRELEELKKERTQ
ncbi:MAG: UDP-3-O-(3-hydroxymyristoyl)glucosamine N-acyltransferase [Tannerellaceae bacterium]|jgi:UDP-3-O-[3-hydroxymyristoyl] glucosamine N-acyltransferase|nr:UDP-3-O-(3-hydroxymyristoyl)glucosamine N-acyltransferase [Tannerellaceae bacterium]